MWVILSVLGCVAVAGCAEPMPPGAELYDALCAGCHGQNGDGDGAVAAELPVAPADLTRLAARNDGVFPKDHAMAWIHGYPDRYNIRVMPEFGPLLDGPMVRVQAEDGTEVLTSKALVQIVAYLEAIQQTE